MHNYNKSNLNTTMNNEENSFNRNFQRPKNRLSILEEGMARYNNVGGEIITVLPKTPIAAYLDDLFFIITIPKDGQEVAPVYIRLQDKFNTCQDRVVVPEFTEIHSTGYLKQRASTYIICAPQVHVMVELTKLVVIATVPFENYDRAPCYIKPRTARPGKRNNPLIDTAMNQARPLAFDDDVEFDPNE